MQNSGIVIPTKSSKFYNVWVILYKLGVFFIFLLFALSRMSSNPVEAPLLSLCTPHTTAHP